MDVAENTIFYYLREKYWNQCRKFCEENFKLYTDPSFLFWRAYASYMNGQVNDAINDLNQVAKKKEIQFAAVEALIYYHRQCQTVDYDAINNLSMIEDDARRSSGDKSFILLAHWHMLQNEISEADEYLNTVNGDSVQIRNARAWFKIYENLENSSKDAMDDFDKILNDDYGGGTNNLEALLGKAKASELSKKYSITIETLNEIIIVYPNFTPALAEKCRLLMVIADWDQCVEACFKVFAQDDRNILAIKIHTFYLLAREGNFDEGLKKLDTLIQTLEKCEPSNCDLLHQCVQVFTRVSGGDPEILKRCALMIEKAIKMRPIEANFAIEKANISLIKGDLTNAFAQFQEATALDETKVESLMGMIQCRLMQGFIDDAAEQIEFVNEVQVSVGRTSEIAFLEAMLNARKLDIEHSQRVATTLKLLDECLRLHIASTRVLNPGFDFYIKLNPQFLLNLAKEYLQWLDLALGKKVETVPPYILKGNKLLETVTKQIPGLLPAHLLLAKGKLGAGDIGAALRHIERVIEINNQHIEANILYALVSFQVGNIKQAYGTLEEAIANNFSIRESPLFMMVKGEIELMSEDYETALTTLEAAYNLPGAKTQNRGRKKKNEDDSKKKGENFQILQYTDKERCKLHILLAKAYIANNRNTDAKNVMDDAIKNFQGTPEEGNVLMTNAELSVASGDIKKALSILKAVDTTSSYFVPSRKQMAEIYLEKMMDRRHFAQCFVDIIEAFPTYENYKGLGDAFMKIQEPEDAVFSYKKAYELNSNDEELIRLIGQAMVATHDYNQAIIYYETALKKDDSRHDLRLDMGKLCIQLNKYEKAEQLLAMKIFGDEFAAPNLAALKRNVEGLLSIAKLHLKRHGLSEQPNATAREAYIQAVKMQGAVIERTKQEGGNPDAERIVLSEVNFELANYYAKYEKNYSKALEILEIAWKYNQLSEKILAKMSEMHMKIEDKEGAEQRCIQVLRLNQFHEYACLLVSDLMMMKGEAHKAIKQFQRLLEFDSINYVILSNLIGLMYRNGKFDEILPIIEKVQKQCPNSNDPGLCYCKGIYHKYARQPAQALDEFFKAKRGNQFAEEAICNMVDLYLNPDQDLIYSMVGDGVKQVTPQNMNAAENLIRELNNRKKTFKGYVAEAYTLMMQKGKVDSAINKLNELLTRASEFVPAMLAMSIAKFMAGKKDEGKHWLKKVGLKMYSHEYCDDLEKGWLMFSDILIASNNARDAEEILQKCLKYNFNCGKLNRNEQFWLLN